MNTSGPRAWLGDSRIRALSQATALVGLATLVARGLSAIKEMVVAWRIGITSELDAFLLALLVPIFWAGVAASAVPAALVPAMARARMQGAQAEQQLVGEMAGWVLAALLVTTAVGWLAWPPLLESLAPGMPDATRAAARQMFLSVNVVTILTGAAGFLVAVLNGRDSIVAPALVPAATPLLLIALLAISGAGVPVLVVGTLLGAVVELAVLWWLVLHQGVAVRPRFGLSRDTRLAIGELLPTAFGAIALGSTTLVNQVLAAGLDAGSVATFGFGTRVPLVIVALLGTALATAALPHFSAVAATEGRLALWRLGVRYGWLVLLAATVGTILLLLVNRPLVQLMFERGAWTPADTDRVALVQACALLQVPFYCVSLVAARMVSALQANRWLFWGAALTAVVNLIASLVLVQYFGVAGLAAAAACVYAVSTAFLWAACRREALRP